MLEPTIKQYDSVDYLVFSGNYGDDLIHAGFCRLFDDLDIDTRDIDEYDEPKRDTLFVNGGGNLVPYYRAVSSFLVKHADAYENVVILPHTIYGNRAVEAINGMSADVVVFGRDLVSVNFCMENVDARVHIGYDGAFFNDLGENGGEGVLKCFRKGIESKYLYIPDGNQDISSGDGGVRNLTDWLDVISAHEQIHTDRLHVAIAGALMEKDVMLYPNRYFKNKAVFDYSLAEFPNVEFSDAIMDL